jgi:hypothetical protein
MHRLHDRSGVTLRHRLHANRPGHDVDVLFLDQFLEQRDLVVVPVMPARIEEAADQQIGFLGATVVRAEVQALEADFAVHETPTTIGRRALAVRVGWG